jgi:dCTP deaminase
MTLEFSEYYGVLSDIQIKKEIKKENLFIEPFHPQNLSNTSYDVTLGPNYYRACKPEYLLPWDDQSIHQYWGLPQYAKIIDSDYQQQKFKLPLGTKYILLEPGELILAHTNEFIGGYNNITTMMKARSSMGRVGISICKDAGWGDVGYVNRWTMEISNFSASIIPLVVGSRVAQIVFFYTGNVSKKYDEKGAYQMKFDNVDKLMEQWTVSDMLPRYRF